MNEPLVKVSDCLSALGQTRGSEGNTLKLIKRYGIEVVHEMPYGRGVLRMMRKAQMEELIEKHRPKTEAIESLDEARALIANRESKEALEALRSEIAELRKECQELRATIGGNSQALEVLIRQNNHLTDSLNKVLKELGVTPSGG